MTTHIALLRAVNLASHKRISMSDLRAFATELGLEDVSTLLQSGNLVFRGGSRKGAALEQFLEAEAAKRLRLETKFIVRTAAQWTSVLKANPFPEEAKKDPSHLLVMFLKTAPKAAAVKSLEAAIQGRETVRARGQEVYLVYPDGIGRSRLTNALIEKKLGTRGTGRNWNTVMKLAERARP